MDPTTVSPKITSLSWGQIKVDDGSTYRDAKLFPGGSREWNWRETGTHHSPGIQLADVQELLDNGAQIIILTRGMNQQLKVKADTLEKLNQLGVKYHILQTEEAVRLYNELQTQMPVGGLFHSTC